MSRQKIAISAAPSGTSARLGCSRDALAATNEPSATPMAKTVRQRLMTYSLPLKAICTKGGRSAIAMKPTSQNQETTMAPIHSLSIDTQACDQRKRRGQRIAGDLEVWVPRARSGG